MRNNYSYHIGEICWILSDRFFKLDFFIVVEEEFIYNSIAYTRNVLSKVVSLVTEVGMHV